MERSEVDCSIARNCRGMMRGQRRYMGGEDPFDGFLVRGKFAANSTASGWIIHPGSNTEKVDISEYVDPTTREFKYLNPSPMHNLSHLFWNVSSLEKIYEFKANDVTSLFYTFFGINYATSVDISGLNSKKCNVFSGIFQNNTRMVDLTIDLDLISATSIGSMFQLCNALKNVKGKISNVKLSLDLHWSPLTNESAMVFINGLAEVETPQTITFSAATYATLTPEQIALAESKNWIVAHA